MATRIKAPQGADASQLRQELSQFAGVTVTDPDADGAVFVDVDDLSDASAVAFRVGRHFPRSFIMAILAVDFEGLDFDAPTTLAGMKAVLNMHKARCIELRNRTAKALRARWE